MTNKITKAVLKELKTIADQLPKMVMKEETKKRIVHGSRAIANGAIRTKDSLGIDPNGWYSIEEPVEVNHMRKLKRAYITGGKEAVMNYGVNILKVAKVKTDGKENTTTEQGNTPVAIPAEHAQPEATAGGESNLRKNDEQHGADVYGSKLIDPAAQRIGY